MVAMLILSCVVVSVGCVYVYLHQDDLKQIALDKLNESLDATLTVSQSDVSFFRTIPNVSISFDKPLVHTINDTLLSCDVLQLKLNLIDFIKKDYRIDKLALKDGLVHLKTLENGEPNYKIWKTSTDSTVNVNFEIETIEIDNIHLDFQDIPTQNSYDFYIQNIVADVQLNSDVWFINMDGFLQDFIYGEESESIIEENEIKIAAEMIYDDLSENLSFSGFDVTNDNVFATGNGDIKLGENEKDIDISFKAKGTPNGILNVFKNFYSLPENYTCAGDVDIDASLYYKMGDQNSLSMTNEFAISNGIIKESKSRERIEDISYDGIFEISGENYNLTTRSLTCEMQQGILNANGTIKDLKNPIANLQFQGTLDLNELSQFFALEGLDIDGELQFNNRITGNYTSSDLKTSNWINQSEITGEAKLMDASIEWPEQELKVSRIHGDLDFSETSIAIKDLTAQIKKTHLKLNGVVSNILNYLANEDESIKIEAFLEAEEIDLEDFISNNKNSIHRSALSFPERFNFKLNSNIENFIFKTFRAEDIKGVLTFEDKMFKANHIAFNSCNGQVMGNLSIKSENETFYVESNSTLKDLDITEIFDSFAQFDQDFITSKHISGVTTSTCKFNGQMDPFLNFDKRTIETVADIQISNGELINHPPMQEISVYLRKKSLLNPFLKVDELEQNLKHLSFNTLENRIEIKDELITIPKMEIQSSAMDANITGSHSFDHKIDYRIDFRMREMLKEREVEIEEIIVEDDGTGSRIFLAMTGTSQNPDISFDKESARAKRKSDIQNAKEEFLNIFKKKEKEPQAEENDIKIEVDQKKSDSIIASNKKKKGLKKLLDNITKEEKDNESVDFEIVEDEE